MNTLYINYTKTGNPISDHQVESNILSQASICVNGQDKEWRVSTENVITAVRLMKLTGKITCNLEIMFEGHIVEMNCYCVIVYGYPYGFCDYVDRWSAELLTQQMKLKKLHSEILSARQPKNIGVICTNSDNFLDYRIKQGHDTNEFSTKRKYIHNNVTYWRIADVCDLCSLTLDKIVETLDAKKNLCYDKIIIAAQSNLILKK